MLNNYLNVEFHLIVSFFIQLIATVASSSFFQFDTLKDGWERITPGVSNDELLDFYVQRWSFEEFHCKKFISRKFSANWKQIP